MHWKVGVNAPTFEEKKWGVHDPPPQVLWWCRPCFLEMIRYTLTHNLQKAVHVNNVVSTRSIGFQAPALNVGLLI